MSKSLEEVKEIRSRLIQDYGCVKPDYLVAIMTRRQVAKVCESAQYSKLEEISLEVYPEGEEHHEVTEERAEKYPFVPESKKDEYCLFVMYDENLPRQTVSNFPLTYEGVNVFLGPKKSYTETKSLT